MYLNCHTFHSLRYGTLSVKNLVESAARAGVDTLCLTDINTMTAIYEFLQVCRGVGIKPIVGMEFRVDEELLYIVLAKSADSLSEINQLLTDHNCENKPLPQHQSELRRSFVIYPIGNMPETLLEHEYIGVRPEQINLLFQEKYKGFVSKMVILQPVTVQDKEAYKLHKVLRAIDLNTLISLLKDDQ